jgi:SAM-dependent methyltransferase
VGAPLRGGAAIVVSASGGRYGELFERELPEDLEDHRLLELIDPEELPSQGEFDFVLCRNLLRTTTNPMAFLNELWRLTSPGATLLLEAEVLTEPEQSRLARFVPGAGWVPGRLTLRWMLEVSGFDVERWLDDGSPQDGTRAALRATRAEREPDSSTPP